jgi:hypothetical protein
MTKDFIGEINELRRERQRLGLSTLQLSTFFKDVSYRAVYRWLHHPKRIYPAYRKILRDGIRQLKKLPTPKADPLSENRRLYRLVREYLTPEEKKELFELEFDQYGEKLKELMKKYRINAE